MTEMIAWLHAQILADKAAADAATPGPWHAEIHRHRHTKVPVLFEVHPVAELEGNGDGGVQTAADAEHIARHDPADVIADCDAKLAILAEYERIAASLAAYTNPGNAGAYMAAQTMVKLVAQGYRHRDGWRKEWAA